MRIHLAIDIGASSGRHIAAWRENGELIMKEVYRFANGPKEQNGSLIWDLDALVREVKAGLAACKAAGITPTSVAIDTWGVDYVLLDKTDAPILPLYCYRDARGGIAAEKVHEQIPFSTLYTHTGTQYQPFNTIYQLYSDKIAGRLEKAADFLFLPEYLSFILSGKKAHEYTIASTSGLINAASKEWDSAVIKALGLPAHLFTTQPQQPPVKLGTLCEAIVAEVGFTCDVLLPASHDTASAIAALPQKGAYISSGTWSLLGTELDEPVTSEAAMQANFANEGGVGTIRFLKNIIGLWLVQCLKKELNDVYSYPQLAEMARESATFDYHLDVNSERYLAPKSVMGEITAECTEKGLPVPKTPGEFAHAIYQSLAHTYKAAIDDLEAITGVPVETLCIVGGGANNTYLNECTQRAINRPVITGSGEATALGNILLQEAAYV